MKEEVIDLHLVDIMERCIMKHPHETCARVFKYYLFLLNLIEFCIMENQYIIVCDDD